MELVGKVTVSSEMLGEVRSPAHRDRVWVLFHCSVGDLEPVNPRFLLFGFHDAKNVGFRPVDRWFRRAPLLEPVYNLYLSAIPTQSPRLEYRFLALAQAIDAYYFRRISQRSTDYVNIVRALQSLLPRKVRARVPTRFADLVKDTRHYFMHWNPKYEPLAAKDADLVAAWWGLKLILELVLLRERRYSVTDVGKIAENNIRVGQTIRMSFDQL